MAVPSLTKHAPRSHRSAAHAMTAVRSSDPGSVVVPESPFGLAAGSDPTPSILAFRLGRDCSQHGRCSTVPP